MTANSEQKSSALRSSSEVAPAKLYLVPAALCCLILKIGPYTELVAASDLGYSDRRQPVGARKC